jgi:hypothetical protein
LKVAFATPWGDFHTNYEAAGDGQRLVTVSRDDTSDTRQVNVILNALSLRAI